MSSRGNRVIIQGSNASVERATALVKELRDMDLKGYALRKEEIRSAISAFSGGETKTLKKFLSNSISVSSKKKSVVPKTANQIRYINAIRKYDMVFCIGPAGTGKTYLAMAMAVNSLLNNKVSRVVLARPAVEAGEKLGFLPGDMLEKVHPYLRPLYDALFDMLEVDRAHRLIEKGVIEVAPLAFMRGRTLNDSFIILDEAQNTTYEQMKMYLTRLGFNSKTVITGDITQIDLPPGTSSGLVEAEKILGIIEGIKVVYFSEKDVVRHKLVQKIVKAYEKHERKKTEETEA
jgi:phosphate starvation-inducible PhoH-like protein